MKKAICVLLSLIFALSLSACKEKKAENDVSSVPQSSGAEAAGNGKALVVYYSATGSTKSAAEKMAKVLTADIFEVVPEKPYTSADLNWNDEDSRVSREHNDESLRNIALVKSTPDNWDQYDTVYIGYPIWWGIAAWPIDGFVKSNDFTGKTVIPFCTSASSGIGESGEKLKSVAGTGDWKEGKRFSSSVSENEITDWLSQN